MTQGEYAYNLAAELFPICRSITGNGVRKTLKILQREVPELKIKEVPSGTQVFDWTVPKEWNITDAWVKDKNGSKIIDFSETNLHVMGYSIPVHKTVTLNELMSFIYTEPEQPDVIPYITSYYKERYGFCISENQKIQMLSTYSGNDEFEIYIDSTLENGSLTYGEIIIPSTEKNNKEIFISTYICHPSLANNELSGPCVSITLAKWLKNLKKRKYTYRLIYIPETIGSITYLSKNYKELQNNVIAGFNLTCVGDDRTYSYMPTAYGNTLADKVLQNVLSFHFPEYKKYSFLISGSDERRYSAPGIDLPVVGFSRSLYSKYPEYHTSADNLSLISPSGLQGSFDVISKCITALEWNANYKMTCLCEPQLGKRGLYPTVSRKGQYDEVFRLKNLISYLNGKNDLIDVSNIIKVSIEEIIETLKKLKENNLIKEVV
ncbi:MAG: DUF4910 domain-containing protein [Spirochaetales bacterium]|nr:DUF4910 domain-containing protein [Spirochaetales bacterium]